MKDAWDYIYGEKSHMNTAGKILIGIPMFPFFCNICGYLAPFRLFIFKKECITLSAAVRSVEHGTCGAGVTC